MATAAVIGPSRDPQDGAEISSGRDLTDYYVYQLDNRGNRINPPYRLKCVEDAAAYVEAQLLLPDQNVEVWCDGFEMAKILMREQPALSFWSLLISVIGLVGNAIRPAGVGAYAQDNEKSI